MEELKTITTVELQDKLEKGEKVAMIDVREDEEVAAGMIPGAKHIKMGEIPMNVDALDPDTEYVIICRSGARSENVSYFLQDHGIKVRNMVGGMMNWRGDVK